METMAMTIHSYHENYSLDVCSDSLLGQESLLSFLHEREERLRESSSPSLNENIWTDWSCQRCHSSRRHLMRRHHHLPRHGHNSRKSVELTSKTVLEAS